jgi:hypothetical protein
VHLLRPVFGLGATAAAAAANLCSWAGSHPHRAGDNGWLCIAGPCFFKVCTRNHFPWRAHAMGHGDSNKSCCLGSSTALQLHGEPSVLFVPLLLCNIRSGSIDGRCGCHWWFLLTPQALKVVCLLHTVWLCRRAWQAHWPHSTGMLTAQRADRVSGSQCNVHVTHTHACSDSTCSRSGQ